MSEFKKTWYWIVSWLSILTCSPHPAQAVPAAPVPPGPHAMSRQTPAGCPSSAEFARVPTEDGLEYVLVIRVDFSDKPGQKTAADFEQAFFGDDLSLMAYYRSLSRNATKPMIVSHPAGPAIYPASGAWIRMPNPMSYYGRPASGSGYPDDLKHLKEMVQDAFRALLTQIDLSQYDRDGDGFLDHLMIVHAGNDEAETGRSDDLWSLRFTGGIGTFNGIKINAAVVVPENPGSAKLPIGTICHEFFHGFGAPDLYDYRLGTSGLYEEAVGDWCLMGGGSFLGSGQKPAAICGYLQWDFDGRPSTGRNGWITPTDIADSQTGIPVQNPGVAANQSLYRVFIPGTANTEFFLIENRHASNDYAYDRQLPGPDGLLIFHVDEKMTPGITYPHPAGYNDGPPLMAYYRIWLEDEIDDVRYLGRDALSDAAFSLNQKRSFLSSTSQPGTAANGQTQGEFKIYDISHSGKTMTFSVDFDPPDPPEAIYVTGSYPNPFSRYTQIQFGLPTPVVCQFGIYNLAGQRVYHLSQAFEEGDHTLIWDGRDQNGQRAAIGQYLYKLEIGNRAFHGRMVWIPEK